MVAVAVPLRRRSDALPDASEKEDISNNAEKV
jgi:hypothetical protein